MLSYLLLCLLSLCWLWTILQRIRIKQQIRQKEKGNKEGKISNLKALKDGWSNFRNSNSKGQWAKNHKAITAGAAVTTVATVAGVSYLGYKIYKKWKNNQEKANLA